MKVAALLLLVSFSAHADEADCRFLANLAAQAALFHQEQGIARENYIVAWSTDEHEREGEAVLDEAFETTMQPYEFGQFVYDRCMGREI
jgi:hypothetical protein